MNKKEKAMSRAVEDLKSEIRGLRAQYLAKYSHSLRAEIVKKEAELTKLNHGVR